MNGLITDRTFSDVEAVKKLTASIQAGTATEEQVQSYLNEIQKGAYTYRDLNRVEAAVSFLANRFKEIGYTLSLQTVETWSPESKPNKKDFDRYFGNVAQLRSVVTVWRTTPETPNSIAGFDVNRANALEQILKDIDQILNHIQAAWFLSGDLYSGEAQS